ncbi:MAG: BrnA antitoxin family protein [Rhodospirillales bacterium]
MKSLTDWKRVDALTDADIAEAIRNDPDTEEFGRDFWKDAWVEWPSGKATITMTIDRDVLAFFRKGGRGYQTRINAVLRSFMRSKLAAPRARRKAA